jgi:hypothetical protein
MKRTALKRSAPMKRGSKPLPSVNRARQDKRRAEYRKYLASPQWKALREKALERAGGQCEFAPSFTGRDMVYFDYTLRCPETAQLSVHHLSYPRGPLGTESLDTLQVLCRRHHELEESKKWWRKP